MDTPPPLPVRPKQGTSAVKVIFIVFGSLAGVVVLALAGLFVLGLTGADTYTPMNGEPSSHGRPASVGFTPQSVEARCRDRGLEYYAGESSNRLWSRATEQQQEELEARGIKMYRIKIRKRYDVVFILSVIESPRDFSSSEAKEVLAAVAPPTPVAVNGRFIYCFAGRPDPKGSTGDDVIWMTPQALFDSL
jgi:hypothetical protein